MKENGKTLRKEKRAEKKVEKAIEDRGSWRRQKRARKRKRKEERSNHTHDSHARTPPFALLHLCKTPFLTLFHNFLPYNLHSCTTWLPNTRWSSNKHERPGGMHEWMREAERVWESARAAVWRCGCVSVFGCSCLPWLREMFSKEVVLRGCPGLGNHLGVALASSVSTLLPFLVCCETFYLAYQDQQNSGASATNT